MNTNVKVACTGSCVVMCACLLYIGANSHTVYSSLFVMLRVAKLQYSISTLHPPIPAKLFHCKVHM